MATEKECARRLMARSRDWRGVIRRGRASYDDEPAPAQGLQHVLCGGISRQRRMILGALSVSAMAKRMGHGVEHVTRVGLR